MLRKDVYPYEYIDDWKKINETLPEKEDFYSHLNMEDITGSDYAHSKIVCKDFESKNLGKYHELYAQSDTLLLAAYLRTLKKRVFKIYELDPACFLSVSGLAWQVALKKNKAKLDLLTDIDPLQVTNSKLKNKKLHFELLT